VCSFGILGSIFIGWLMDRTGLETCTALTLVMGSSQSLILTLFSDKSYMMILGFVMYSFFRQFLFPVFVASLSAKMGFKYYGILSGIGFALSGLSQLYIATVVEAIEGSCHECILDDEEPCTQGSWKVLHMIQCIVLLLLLGIPAYDRWWNVQSEPRLRKRVDLTNQQHAESSQLYGALEGIVEADTPVEGGISL
jgi:MFS family permease